MPDLSLKQQEEPYLEKECGFLSDKNPDQKASKTIEDLELNETSLRYSLRAKVAWFLAVCCGAIMLAFVWHLVAPEWLCWLAPSRLETIKNVALTAFGGLALSIGTIFISKK